MKQRRNMFGRRKLRDVPRRPGPLIRPESPPPLEPVTPRPASPVRHVDPVIIPEPPAPVKIVRPHNNFWEPSSVYMHTAQVKKPLALKVVEVVPTPEVEEPPPVPGSRADKLKKFIKAFF